jgi:thioester reductase-like protein
LLTGCTGAIGSQILQHLLEGPVECVHGLFSRPDTYSRLRATLPALDWGRVRPIYVDLRSEESAAVLRRELAGVKPDAVIHAAANVSWTKSEAALEDLNVFGAIRIAAWAADTVPGARLIAFSTPYAHRPSGIFLNGYERSKFRAETAIIKDYGSRLRIGVVRPSLVIGHSESGAIGSFNGLYPLVRLIAFGEVPCVVADRDYPMDLVPVDWVVEDLLHLCTRLESASAPLFVTTAAGPQSLRLHEVIEVITLRLRAFCAQRNLAAPAEVSIITRRQADFLMRAAASWNLERRFEQARRMSEIMTGYLNHTEEPIALSPTNARVYPGGGRATLGRCVDFWLSRHAARLSTPRNVEWSEAIENA